MLTCLTFATAESHGRIYVLWRFSPPSKTAHLAHPSCAQCRFSLAKRRGFGGLVDSAIIVVRWCSARAGYWLRNDAAMQSAVLLVGDCRACRTHTQSQKLSTQISWNDATCAFVCLLNCQSYLHINLSTCPDSSGNHSACMCVRPCVCLSVCLSVILSLHCTKTTDAHISDVD